ncbi:hypothetical protein [Mesorhizobium delmotii]|uniref:hypothetical protein n=1 Tax=Mesorhizobium delmotii TaxID=1631247 RepID=UPI001402A851|nr:hypothetical protein [Mesorhizobium delmotii]
MSKITDEGTVRIASDVAAIGSIDPPDTALFETEHSILPALLLKIGKQVVPCTQEFAAVVAKDPVVRTGVGRNPQPYCQAIRALQLVVEILLGHGRWRECTGNMAPATSLALV